VWTEDFDSDPVGQAPPNWAVAGPAGCFTVQPDGSDHVVRLQRAVEGDTLMSGVRAFGEPLTSDVRLTYRIKAEADQIEQAVGVQLVDAAGNPVLRCNAGVDGVFRYSDGSHFFASPVTYAAGTWYDIDLIFRAAADRYTISIGGTFITDAAAWPGSTAPAVVEIFTRKPAIAAYSFDDITVYTPAQSPSPFLTSGTR
jgi:hypothetical protein